MKTIREKCFNSYWFYFLAAVLFWEPDFIKQQVRVVDRLFDAGNVAMLLLLVVFYGMALRELVNRYDLTAALLGLVLIVSTIHYSGIGPNLWKCLKYEWPIAAMILLIEQGARTKPQKMIRAFYHMYYINIVINFVLSMIFREGLFTEIDHEAQHWLGNENVFIVSMLAGLCCGYLDVLRRGKKITADYLILHVLCIMQLVWMWSVTSMLGIACYTALLALAWVVHSGWFYSLKLYSFLWVCAFFFFTVFQLHKKTLKWLITGIFHKSVSLSKRTKLWRRILKRIRKRPILGYGVLSPDDFRKMTRYSNKHWVHAHNYILELLIRGGVMAVGVFAALVLWTSQELKKLHYTMPARVISITLCSYFVIFCGDCFEMRTPFYVILTLGYVCRFLTEPSERMEEKHNE